MTMNEATLRAEERAEAASPAASESPAVEGPAVGARMGRYIVLSTLGMGTMGVVVLAYDPELDRRAALKLIRKRGSRSGAAQARLAREAQALAKLNHPNVVTLYDVGVHEGQVFVAMEFVQGTTLRAWLEHARGWRDVLRVFSAAGRGLAAAHEVGLVHRDFKPENVMLDAEERARVMDFGLARARDDSPSEDTSEEPVPTQLESPGWRSTPLHEPLTRTGALLGTPAYMAPEQWLRVEVSPRSDQFSFCVALYEALYGQHPFAGDTLETLGRAVVRGELATPPRASKVPSHVRRALLRGLARNPGERHDSMRALLDALADDPRLRWQRRGLASLITALSLAAAWGLWHASASKVDAPARPCTGAHAQLEGAWDEARRHEVETAILASGPTYAAGTWARIEPRLDGYAATWAAEHTDACEATRVRGEQSEADMSLRMDCLHDRWLHLRATVDELRSADATIVRNAVEAITKLPRIDRCSDLEALRAEQPPPEDPEVARAVARLDEALVAAKAKQDAGKFAEALQLADAVVVESATLDYPPLRVRAWARQGALRELGGDFEGASESLRSAYDTALSLGMLHEAAWATGTMVHVLGFGLSRPDEARAWAIHADPLSRAAKDDELRARYFDSLSSVAFSQERLDEARELQERALSIREQMLARGGEPLLVTGSLNNLGIIAAEQGHYDEAHDVLARSLAIREDALAPDHPEIASLLNNLGLVCMMGGRHDEARELLTRALGIQERTQGPDHFKVTHPLTNLGQLAIERGDYAQAREMLERALAITERVMGPDHAHVANTLTHLALALEGLGEHERARELLERALGIVEAGSPEGVDLAEPLVALGRVALAQGRIDEARRLFERAMDLRERVLGPDHLDVGYPLYLLGDVALAQARYDEARNMHARALALFEARLPDEHPDLAYPLTGLGEAWLGLGEPNDARPLLERAQRIRARHVLPPRLLQRTNEALARLPAPTSPARAASPP